MNFKYPNKAFILAAGMGSRLRPYTDNCPKPLVKVGSKTLIDHALDKLILAGVTQTTINLHYMGDTLKSHLINRKSPNLVFSEEEILQDTGGGVKKALSSVGTNPFYLLNGDTLWTDGPVPALTRLAKYWDSDKMDILMLLQPIKHMTLTNGVGDYNLEDSGQAIRSKNKSGEFMFASLRIVNPKIFQNTPSEPFSFLQLMDEAERNGRLFGLPHDAQWHHISTAVEYENVLRSYGQLKRIA
jgi:MurNAc alpha-1-phosphate uridylyltransferase